MAGNDVGPPKPGPRGRVFYLREQNQGSHACHAWRFCYSAAQSAVSLQIVIELQAEQLNVFG
jgi:hypothetical protein